MKGLHCTLLHQTRFLYLAVLFVVFNASSAAPQPPAPARQTTSTRPDADSIVLTVTVTDKKGYFIGGLEKSAFTVFDNNVSQEISSFAAKDEPISIAVLVDFSESMFTPGQAQLKEVGIALHRFATLSNAANEYLLIGFASRPRVLVDWTNGGSAFAELLSQLRTVVREGSGTAVYDACYMGLEKLKESTHAKRVLLLVSDGMDNESHYKLKEVREALSTTEATLYSVGIFGDVRLPPIFQGALAPPIVLSDAKAAMRKLSSLSGGVALFPGPKKSITVTLEAIAIELRHQYLLGFKPPAEKADAKWHQLKIIVSPPANAPASMSNLSVRSREGYYSAKNPR